MKQNKQYCAQFRGLENFALRSSLILLNGTALAQVKNEHIVTQIFRNDFGESAPVFPSNRRETYSGPMYTKYALIS